MKYKLYHLTSSLDNNKPRYVGYTTDIERRLKEHISSIGNVSKNINNM